MYDSRLYHARRVVCTRSLAAVESFCVPSQPWFCDTQGRVQCIVIMFGGWPVPLQTKALPAYLPACFGIFDRRPGRSSNHSQKRPCPRNRQSCCEQPAWGSLQGINFTLTRRHGDDELYQPHRSRGCPFTRDVHVCCARWNRLWEMSE